MQRTYQGRIKQIPENIAENIKRIKSVLPPYVSIAAAAKHQPAWKIRAALRAGITIVAENYVQEAVEKINALRRERRNRARWKPGAPGVEFHFIGRLQSNKAKKAAALFDMVQTVDSKKLALKLDRACEGIGKKLRVLIQVNIGGEGSKAGVLPETAGDLAAFVLTLKHLKLEGLMALEPLKNSLRYFKAMKRLFDELNKKGYGLTILSMGTSANYKDAVKAGATMVRLGTALFGPRKLL